jgi:hypothetical protein
MELTRQSLAIDPTWLSGLPHSGRVDSPARRKMWGWPYCRARALGKAVMDEQANLGR